MTNSCSFKTLSFCHFVDRPDSYLLRRSFANTPSRPILRAASNICSPSVSYVSEMRMLPDRRYERFKNFPAIFECATAKIKAVSVENIEQEKTLPDELSVSRGTALWFAH